MVPRRMKKGLPVDGTMMQKETWEQKALGKETTKMRELEGEPGGTRGLGRSPTNRGFSAPAAGAPGAFHGAPGGPARRMLSPAPGLGTVPERPWRHPPWASRPGGCRALPRGPPWVPRHRAAGTARGGYGSDARGDHRQRRGRGGRLRPGGSGVPILTFCGAPGACPSCRPPRTAWAAACGPAGPALPGEENSREPA